MTCEALQGAGISFVFTSFQSSLEDHQALKLVWIWGMGAVTDAPSHVRWLEQGYGKRYGQVWAPP